MPATQLTQNGFRSDINGLRGISVALVVLFHSQVRVIAGGFVGVDVFFVISGFLMTKIIIERWLDQRFSYWWFLKARATRIWPALGALLFVLLLVGVFLLPPADLVLIGRQGIWAVSFLSNEYFRSHSGYATLFPDGNWLLHTWSLSVEWQFYLLYPLIIWLALSFSASKRDPAAPSLRVLRWLLLALFALSLTLYLRECATAPESAFFGLVYRAWEMLAGGIVYVWLGSGQRDAEVTGVVIRAKGQARGAVAARFRTAASFGGLALLLGSVLWIGRRHFDPVGLGYYSLLPVLGTALVLSGADRRNLLLNNAPLQALGRWSYSIYLWHWPLIVACAMGAVLERHHLAGMLAVVAGSTLLGAASYRFIESSPGRGRRAPLWRYRALVLLVLAAVASAATLGSDGLAFRVRHAGGALSSKPARESDYFPGPCSNFRKPVTQVRPCTIEKGTRRILVIGDSVAEHFYPWFKAHSEASVDFLTEAECPPIPNFDRMQNGFHCMDYAQLAWDETLQDRYDTVIVSANWLMIGGIGPPYCHRETSGVCRNVEGAERTNLARTELHDAIQRTLDRGKTVVFVDPTPHAYLNVPQRLAREQLWFGEPRLRINVADIDQENAWIEGMLDSLRGTPHFHLVSLRPEFCDNTSCATYDRTLQRPIFVDDRHFDPLWMREHGGAFLPFSGDTAATD